ncbi:hypothetical protein [Microbulbifer discodermiae]|uniref:hypothetical protein n=1 Tax=Microbulbifer sp. 2201CG32-9 TaxID=3232309 RepID=UPI00345C283F
MKWVKAPLYIGLLLAPLYLMPPDWGFRISLTLLVVLFFKYYGKACRELGEQDAYRKITEQKKAQQERAE